VQQKTPYVTNAPASIAAMQSYAPVVTPQRCASNVVIILRMPDIGDVIAYAAGPSATAAMAATGLIYSVALRGVLLRLPQLLQPHRSLLLLDSEFGGSLRRCKGFPEDNWELLPAPPAGSAGHYEGAAAGLLGDFLYVCGGECISEGLTASIRAFNIACSAWEPRPPMPTARADCAVAAVGKRLYVVGGGRCFLGGGALEDVAAVESYDPSIGIWQILASMPTARSFWCTSAAATSRKLYVLGGCSVATAQAFECYDAHTCEWESLPPLPTARIGCSLVAAVARLFAIGGNVSPEEAVSTTEIFDPCLGQWEQVAAMPTARRSSAVVASLGMIYVMGGYQMMREQTCVVECFDSRCRTWEVLPSLPSVLNRGFAAIVRP